MQTASSAAWTKGALLSTVEWIATVLIPSSLQVRTTRWEISPRFATRTLEKGGLEEEEEGSRGRSVGAAERNRQGGPFLDAVTRNFLAVDDDDFVDVVVERSSCLVAHMVVYAIGVR
jgi:hypothetical protein